MQVNIGLWYEKIAPITITAGVEKLINYREKFLNITIAKFLHKTQYKKGVSFI